ncbi:MAG: tyrosine-type recombinase/integrase [Chthoniobacterales bacterium]
MKAQLKMTATNPLKKIASGLYRNESSGAHYAKFKANGNQVYQNLETTDEAVARRKLKRLRVDYEDFHPQGKGSRKFLDRCRDYLATVAAQAPSTVYNKTLVVKRIEEEFRDVARDIRKISPTDCQIFLAGFKGNSWHRQALGVLKEIFRLGLADGLITKSPVEGLKQRRGGKIIRDTPSDAQFYAIVDSIRSQKFNAHAHETADYVQFLGEGGVGKREASELEWRYVHWDRNRMTLFRFKTRTAFETTMTRKLRRLLLKRLAKVRKLPGQVKEKREVKMTDRVFSVFHVKRAIDNACKRLGYPRYTTRSFRRVFIKKAIKAGINVKAIAASQGHQDGGQLILSTYSSDFDDQIDELGEALDKAG